MSPKKRNATKSSQSSKVSREVTDSEVVVVNGLARKMYAIAKDHGFHQETLLGRPISIERIGVYVANLHGEVSELWEAARKGRLNASCDKPISLTCAEEELADIAIRLMDTAVGLCVNLGLAIKVKADYNQSREHMHGKKA